MQALYCTGVTAPGPFDRLAQLGRAAAILLAGMFLSYGTMLASAGGLLLSVVIAPAYFGLGFGASRWLGTSLWEALLCGAAVPLVIQSAAMAFRLGIVIVPSFFGFAAAAGLLYWGWRVGRKAGK
jgi:hypothetical protein